MDSFEKISSRVISYENNQTSKIKQSILLGFLPLCIFIWVGFRIFYLGWYFIWGSVLLIICIVYISLFRDFHIYNERRAIHRLFTRWIHTSDTIESILSKTQVTANTLKSSLKLRRIYSLKGLRINYFNNLIRYYTFILTDLRWDLDTRIREQQRSLEWAKVEVEKHIRWTSELEQVSELQKARLDRQIEQFEELQRVLVKV